MSVRYALKAVVASLALATVGLVWAVPAEAAGDPVKGQQLGYTCLGCHGIETYKNVYPTFSVPKLRGQHPEYIVAALKEYKNGQRNHGTMHAHAASLSDQDMEDIAVYLAGDVVKAETNAKPVGTPPAAIAICQSCHGATGVGLMNIYPTLSGQHADYLEHALNSYRSGARKNEIMKPWAAQLKPEDVKQLALFFSRQKPALQTVPKREPKKKELVPVATK